MPEEVDQLLRANIGKAIRRIPTNRGTEDESKTKAPRQQEQETEKMARGEAMPRDIEDVMSEIQEYFKTRSKEEADRLFHSLKQLRGRDEIPVLELDALAESA